MRFQLFVNMINQRIYSAQTCNFSVAGEFVQNTTCDCPTPCDVREYTTVLSSASYPSDIWAEAAAETFHTSKDYMT